MRRRNGKTTGAALSVFGMLYASTVIGTPLYRNGHTLLRFAVLAGMLLVFTPLITRFAAAHTECPKRGVRIVSAVVFSLAAVYVGAAAAVRFTRPLAAFAPYYGTFPVRFAAGVFVVLCGTCTAYHGTRAVIGFTSAAAWLFPLWTGTGLFAFVTVKTALPLPPPFADADIRVFLDAVLETLPLTADVTVMTLLLYDGKTAEKQTSRGIRYGVAAFLTLAAVNVLKNLLLLGTALAGEADVPNLAAVRLVPMLELPELAVIVGMAAAIAHTAVYAAAAMKLCEPFGITGRRAVAVIMTAVGAAFVCFSVSAAWYADTLAALFAMLCAAASRIDNKKRKQTQKPDTV